MNIKKNALALAAILTAAAMPTGAFAENWADYARKFQISFPGYAGSTALADFPVLVRLSPERNGFDYAKCRIAKGGDLRFADANGNVIPHEIDTWNPDGESLVWVRVPSLTAATTITAYYGNPAPGAASAESVWDSGYVGVWHLGESAVPLAESTGVTTPFATSAGNAAFGTSGIAGGAVDFSSATNGTRLVAADDDDLDGFDSFTIEVWTKSDTTATTSSGKWILSKRWNGGANFAYALGHETPGKGRLPIGKTDGSGQGDLALSSDMLPMANSWAHQAYVRDTSAGAMFCYLDGVSKTTGGTYYGNTLHNSARPLWLGNLNTAGDGAGAWPFNGLIDELRISRVARSADWIKATHDTIAADGFARYNGIADDWKSYSHRFSVSFGGYTGSAALSGFPVLVRIAEYDAGTGKGIRGFSYADMARSDGGDLRFADAEGNLLAHEIDTWNPNGESTVWVKVPSLSAATKITAYYGSAVPCPPSAESVWDSGYVGVWHLGESALPLAESTGVTTPFATKVGTVGLAATGIAGGAVDFTASKAAADAARLVAADDEDLDGFNDFTIELWTKSDTTVNYGRCILSKRYNGGANVAYLMGHESDGCVQLAIGTTDGKSSQRFAYSSGLMPAANVWGHQAIVRDTTAGTRYCYLDGVSKTIGGTYYGNTLHNSARPLWLGNCNTDGDNKGIYPFNGLIDELRISRVARSADWIKATHDTIAASAFSTCSTATENRDATTVIFR